MRNFIPVLDSVPEENTMSVISIVAAPAVQVNFHKFSKVSHSYSILDSESHRVIAPFLLADTPILRYDSESNEYYTVTFPAPIIRELTSRFIRSLSPSSITLEHSSFVPEGVRVEQIFIKNDSKGLSPVGFDEVPEGSAFMQVRVDNPELWNDIVSGSFNGFSVEVNYELHESTPVGRTLDFDDLLDNIALDLI